MMDIEHDELTGLNNRKSMLDVLEQEISKSNSGGQRISFLAFVDIDEMIWINHLIDHQIGDKTIQDLASIMGRQLTPETSIGRIGGEEFLVILRCSLEDAREKLARMMTSFANLELRHNEHVRHPSISICVTQINSTDTVESCLRRVQTGMYLYQNGQVVGKRKHKVWVI
jgi:diguanylate cyclase (GGDEF)-like protein